MASDQPRFFSVGIVVIVINIAILVPLMLYCGYVFNKRNKLRKEEDNQVFFKRRHPTLIYGTIAFCIFFVAIERPISFLIYQMNVIQLPYEYGESDDPFQFFTYALGAFGVYFIFLMREWMVFYSYKHSVASGIHLLHKTHNAINTLYSLTQPN